jgi:hypothetical protein
MQQIDPGAASCMLLLALLRTSNCIPTKTPLQPFSPSTANIHRYQIFPDIFKRLVRKLRLLVGSKLDQREPLGAMPLLR